MTVVPSIMRQLRRIQRLERVVDGIPPARTSGLFELIDEVWGHVATEDCVLGHLASAGPLREAVVAHGVHHTRARLACFAVATCDDADLNEHVGALRAVLRDHAQHEMCVVQALLTVEDGERR
jgi:hypothetical protein